MKVLSLFDGISCGRLALERAGLSVEKYDAFEIDKYAMKVSKNNFPDIVQHGDVFDGNFKKFQGYDLLIGGSPCTYWSVAKKNRETCSICRNGGDLLLCDRCPKSFHLECLMLKPTDIPEGNWYCPTCLPKMNRKN